jgi:nucleotide-binding universal stress UspA family protein
MAFSPKKILVATDFSANAQEATDAAFTLAKVFDARVVQLHVVPISTYVDFASGVDGHAMISFDYRAAVRSSVEASWQEEQKRLEALGLVSGMETIEGGAPAFEISRVASENGYDLLVVGTHGRTGLKHVLLGSVAEAVMRHSKVPVLVIPSQHKQK